MARFRSQNAYREDYDWMNQYDAQDMLLALGYYMDSNMRYREELYDAGYETGNVY